MPKRDHSPKRNHQHDQDPTGLPTPTPTELPEGWKVARLDEILHQRIEKVRVNPIEKYTRLGVHWYAQGPFRKDTVLGKEIKGTFLFRVQPADFIYNRLFAWKGSFGVISESMAGCYVSGEFPTFEVDGARADPWFLWRWFSLPVVWKMIEDKSMGSTRTSRLRFKEEDLLRLIVPLPPLPEQRAIARVLSTIQRAIETQDKLIAAARTLKRALMRHLFTYGAVPPAQAERVPLKETEIGAVPEGWETRELGDVVLANGGIKRGPWGGSIRKDIFVESGYKIYEQKNVIQRNFTIGTYYINDTKFAELKDFEVQGGDILLTGAGTIGKVALVPQGISKGIINQALIRLRLNEDCISTGFFISLFENYLERGILQGMSYGAVLKNFSSIKVLKTLPIVLPSLLEQRAIARILSAVDRKIAAEEKRKAALQTLFKTMLHQLMTGQIRIKDK